MSFTVEQFRLDFSEFSAINPQVYSNGLINFWAGIGDLRLNIDRWGDLRDHGLELFVAHHISISVADKNVAALGGITGQASSLKSSKSVGDVSVSYDNNAMIETDGGNYNLTTYGREFLRLARIVGMGGAQII